MRDGEWDLQVHYYVKFAIIPASIKDGKIIGDNGSLSYVGQIDIDSNGHATAEVHVKRHVPGVGDSWNNLDEYTLLLTGSATGDSFNVEGGIKGSQSRPFKVTGKRQA